MSRLFVPATLSRGCPSFLLPQSFFFSLPLLWYPASFKRGSSEGGPHAEKGHQIYICFLLSSLGARKHTSPPSRRGAGTPLCTTRLQGPSLGSAWLQQCRPILASPPLQVREPPGTRSRPASLHRTSLRAGFSLQLRTVWLLAGEIAEALSMNLLQRQSHNRFRYDLGLKCFDQTTAFENSV